MTAEGWSGSLPTNALLISGPSKTADIENRCLVALCIGSIDAHVVGWLVADHEARRDPVIVDTIQGIRIDVPDIRPCKRIGVRVVVGVGDLVVRVASSNFL